jgi:5-methylcytosine-specific restriction endonuclease McrA
MDNVEELIELVKVSISYAQVLNKLNLIPTGGNYRILKRKINELKLDVTHFTGQGHLKGKTHNWSKKTDLQEILKENSNYQSFKLKNRLLKEDLIENKCKLCGVGSTWNGKKLNLHLDHINGNHSDNRLENLRVLCPNCHSQTETYAGRNKKNNRNK